MTRSTNGLRDYVLITYQILSFDRFTNLRLKNSHGSKRCGLGSFADPKLIKQHENPIEEI